jgi:ribosomal protein S18 acetylase RimI-like enzyme
MIRTLISHSLALTRLFCRGATLSGYLLFSRTGGCGLITKLAVGAAFRRRGIGSALLRRGIAELERPHRRPPPSEIQLHVDPERTEARRLYEAFGFQRAALLAGYYSDNRDALLMRRVNAALSPTKQ